MIDGPELGEDPTESHVHGVPATTVVSDEASAIVARTVRPGETAVCAYCTGAVQRNAGPRCEVCGVFHHLDCWNGER